MKTRTRKALKMEFGIDFTPKMVAQYSARELLLVPNFGKKMLIEVKAWLAANGLTLAPEPIMMRTACPFCKRPF